jgi:hypothetical protein
LKATNRLVRSPETGVAPTTETPKHKMNSHLFYISPKNFARLKDDCAGQPGVDDYDHHRISGNDMVSALIWRSLATARLSAKGSANEPGVSDGPEEQNLPARLEMALNGRPNFSTALPPSYLGNVVFIHQSYLSLSKLTSAQTTISDVARVIRHDRSHIEPSSILDAYTLVKRIPDYDQLKRRFTAVEEYDIKISSLLRLPTDINFGDDGFKNNGRPEAMRPMMGRFEGCFRLCFVLPRKSYGGVEFVVSLYDDELEQLLVDKEFGNYAMFLS